MTVDPAAQLLQLERLGVGEVARAEHGDEQLRLGHLPGARVDDRDAVAREVHQALLAGPVGLPEHDIDLV